MYGFCSLHCRHKRAGKHLFQAYYLCIRIVFTYLCIYAEFLDMLLKDHKDHPLTVHMTEERIRRSLEERLSIKVYKRLGTVKAVIQKSRACPCHWKYKIDPGILDFLILKDLLLLCNLCLQSHPSFLPPLRTLHLKSVYQQIECRKQHQSEHCGSRQATDYDSCHSLHGHCIL